MAGSTGSDSVKQLKIQPDYTKDGTVYHRGDNVRQDRSFQRLRDDVSHVDNVGLHPKYSTTVGRTSETDPESYGLNQIMIRSDYDVECNRSAGL